MAEEYSFITGQKKIFSIPDYVLFGLTLAISTGIGLFYAIKDRNKQNSQEYLLGGREMSIIPVSLSLLVTFMSALTLLGTPAEMYNFNTMYWWLCLGFVIAVGLSVQLFIPFFYKLNITSIFQYIEMRFNKTTRTLAVILFIIPTYIYMAFVLYAPCLALSSVTGLDLWGTVVGVGLVVTVYTSLGGMKAVLWTDTFQAVMILVGLLAVLIEGSIVVGGFSRAWTIATNRSRIMFDDFSFDPSTRHSFWSVTIGGGSLWLVSYGMNQAQIQRALACPSVRKAKQAYMLNLPGLVLITSMCCMIGIVMYAFYADCHPLRFNNLIFSTDQLLPLFVMDILSDFPGLPGVFLSCIISGSLSTISSGLNALSAIIPYDLILPYCCRTLSERSFTILSKVMVFLSGGMVIGMAFVASELGNVLQATMAITSTLGGPSAGIFVLGMFFPWASSTGAIIGCLISTAFSVWICIGAFVEKAFTARPSPVFIHGCNWNITTTAAATTSAATTVMSSSNIMSTVTSMPQIPSITKSSDPFYPLYTVSYFYYTPIAITVTVLVGLVASFITGRQDSKKLDPRLICPVFDKLFPCLPEFILTPLRCGIDHEGKYDVPLKATDFEKTVDILSKNEKDKREENRFDNNIGFEPDASKSDLHMTRM